MKNNKQQTAIEWLFGYMFNPSLPNDEQFQLLQQAKAMHKAEIIQAYDDGVADECIYATTGSIDFEKTGDEYYNETYGGGEQ